MNGMYVAILLPISAIALYYLRYVLLARNPSDARLLPQQELDQIHQQMHGKWQSHFTPSINCGNTQQSQSIDVANGNYTYTYYTKNHGQRQATRALNIYRSPDNKYWFDNYGA